MFLSSVPLSDSRLTCFLNQSKIVCYSQEKCCALTFMIAFVFWENQKPFVSFRRLRTRTQFTITPQKLIAPKIVGFSYSLGVIQYTDRSQIFNTSFLYYLLPGFSSLLFWSTGCYFIRFSFIFYVAIITTNKGSD